MNDDKTVAVDIAYRLACAWEREAAKAERYRAALEAVAAEDELVAENEPAFAVYAYRRCVAQARAALADTP